VLRTVSGVMWIVAERGRGRPAAQRFGSCFSLAPTKRALLIRRTDSPAPLLAARVEEGPDKCQ